MVCVFISLSGHSGACSRLRADALRSRQDPPCPTFSGRVVVSLSLPSPSHLGPVPLLFSAWLCDTSPRDRISVQTPSPWRGLQTPGLKTCPRSVSLNLLASLFLLHSAHHGLIVYATSLCLSGEYPSPSTPRLASQEQGLGSFRPSASRTVASMARHSVNVFE